jgi:hypothetical protein
MRSFTLRLTRLHTLILTLALSVWVASAAKADPLTFTTDGTVGGGTSGPIGFFGNNGELLTPGAFSLGQFQAPSLPDSASLTYNNTPFSVDVTFTASGGATSDVVIKGVLNGTITGNNTSDMLATATSITQSGTAPLPFPINTMSVLGPQTLAPAGMYAGVTDLYAFISFNPAGETLPVPEPTTFALFGTVLAGLGLRRRLRVRA